MIKINLSKLMGEKRVSQKELSRITKIRVATINAYYNEYVQRVNLKDLKKLCDYFDCSLSDLMEYTPEKK